MLQAQSFWKSRRQRQENKFCEQKDATPQPVEGGIMHWQMKTVPQLLFV